MLNFISDRITNILINKGKLDVRGSKEWSDFDYIIRCGIFNFGSLLFILLLNILTHSWLEFLIIVSIFNVMRNFTEGIHAKRLSFCFLFSSCYFTTLSIVTYKIIHNNNLFLYYSIPFLAVLWSIYNYKYIPKANINSEEVSDENDAEELSIDEKKQAYRWCIAILSIIIIGSIFLLDTKIISISISMGLISLQGILSSIGEKIFNFIQSMYIKLIKFNRGLKDER